MKLSKLSFAVNLKDGFTPHKPIIGEHHIYLFGQKENFIKNRSGFYCYLGLPNGKYTIVVQSRFYCHKSINVDSGALDAKLPVVDIVLEPNPNYLFPNNTTLLRGVVRCKGEKDSIITGAQVFVDREHKHFITDQQGRFIFYFNKKQEDEEEEVEQIELKVTKTGFKTHTHKCKLEKKRTCLLEIALEKDDRG